MAQVSWDGFLKNTTQNYVTRTPEQFDAGKYSGEEPRGFFGSIVDNIAGGVEGTVGSAADALGTVLKSEYAKGNASYPTAVVGKWLVDRGIDLNALAAENARRSGTLETYANMGLVDRLTTPSYWYDRRGLLSDASNAVGSMIPFMAMSAAMPNFGMSSIASGLLNGGLSKVGLERAAGLFSPRVAATIGGKTVMKPGGAGTEFLAEGFNWAPTGVIDALANAGEIVAEMRENGHSDKEIADAIQVSMNYELPYDVALQIVQGGLLGGRAVKALTKNGGTGRSIAVNAGAGAAEAGTEGYQELIQTQATEKALGKPTGTFMNPTDEERGAFAAGVIGPLPLMAGRGALNMVQNRFRSGAGQSERIAGTSPAASTDGDDGGAEDADAPVRVGSLADDAAPFIGVTMDNGSQGCVEAVTKVGAKSCPFLAQELDNGVVNVDDLVAHAGNNVIPFDPNSLEEGDVIVYGDGSDPHLHVVLYDGNGGYIGNSTEQNKVVQGTDYTAMGTSENGEALVPTKIIKTGAQFGGTHAAPLMPDFAGLVAGEEDLAQVQERIQKLIDTDGLTPAQHAAILEAAQRIRDMPVGDGTDAAADAEHVNEWQRLIDRKDIKGIFEKDPQKVVQTMAKLGKEQKAQKTRAAIENQQQIDEATQAIHALTAQSVTQPAQTGRVDNTVQGLPGMGETTASVGRSDLVGGYDTAQGGLLTNAPLPPAGGGGQSPQNIQGSAVGTAAENIPVQNSPAHIVGQGTGGGLLTPGLQAYETAQTGGANPLMNVPPAPAQTTAVRPDTAGQGAAYANAAGIPVQNETAMPMQSTAGVIRPPRRPAPVVGVRPNVPQTLPASLAERQALGRSLGRFMTDNHIHIPQQLGYDLMEGNGAAIAAANDKISAWEENRAAQERTAKKGDVNPRQTAQGDAQSTRNTSHDTTYTQKETGAENAPNSVREKSAQNEAENELPPGYRTESGRPLSEADPQEFIIKPNGSRNFGEIPQEIEDATGGKVKSAPIRLRVGTEDGGFVHLVKEHAAQMKQKGYGVMDYINHILQNFNQVYSQQTERSPHRFVLYCKGDESKGFMPIDLELEQTGENYYVIVSAMPHKAKIRGTLLFDGSANPSAVTTDDTLLEETNHNGGVGTSPNTHGKSKDPSTSTISSEAEESKENELNEDERESLKGFSADAKNVYRMVRDKLKSFKNKLVGRSASVGAVLLARHAEIIARKMRAITGKPFTAMDYYRTWVDLRYGDMEKPYGGFTQKQIETQKDAVRKQYEGTAQWMKAPNGEETNLTEDQWLTVRTPAFKSWFGDWENDSANASKVIDENGEPLVVYHGTPLGGFDTFKRQQNYFTSMKWYADRYQDESTSSNFVPDKHENPGEKMTYAVFLNIRKPFDTRNRKERKIFEKEFYRQWGYGAPLSDKGLPDWTDGDDLQEFFEENGYDYDGLLLDEGGIPDNNGGVISRGISYVTFEPNQIKSVDNNGAFSADDANIFHQSAYHGTPHDFDAFDLGAIGTGEGAQAHGYGLYFAKERKVSEGYKKRLSTKRTIIHLGENSYVEYGSGYKEISSGERVAGSSALGFALDGVLAGEGDISSVIQTFENDIKESDAENSAFYKEVVRILRENDSSVEEGVDTSRLFEVEIPDDDVLLDEQKPFDEQPKFVQEKIEELFEKNDAIDLLDKVLQLPIKTPELRQTLGFMRLARKNIRASKEVISVLRDVLDKSVSRSDRINAYRALLDEDIVDFDKMTDSYEDDIDNVEASRDYLEDVLSSYENRLKKQQESYQKSLDSLPGDVNLARMVLSKMRSGREIYLMLSNHFGGDKATSLALNEVGIKGITYDGRRDGRCFVVFDDKAISIIEKFNQQMNAIIKGTTQDMKDGQRIVSLLTGADESTFLHEMGHLFLLDLERLADMSPTSAEELQTVRKWAAWSEGQAAEYKGTPFEAEFADLDAKIRAALKKGDEKTANKLKRQWEHERFARGFERYLQYGEAPTKGLRAVFAKFRSYLQRVYQAFTGTGGRATPEVEAVMARMISMEDSSDLSAYPQGKKTAVYTDSGKKIPVQYRVVSADDLITSHDANALEVNPGYPAALQPRDRERVMMRQQVTGMANSLRPEDLADGRNLNQGAPLIRSDGVVLNGNGRTIAIQRAQARNKERAAAYRAYLMENAEQFGLSKEDIEGVKNPVLVREVQGDISDGLMQDIIGSTTGGARMGASEAAQQDAEKITYAMMDAYVPNDKGDLTTAANRSFVAGILHKLVGKDEMNAYLDKDGHPNADGIQRVKRAIFAIAYGDDELIAKMAESTDDDIRNVSNGMMAAAPMMARLAVKKGVPYVKELQDAISDAVKQLDTLRRSGESVKDYLGAQALFAEHEDSAEMRAILSFLDGNKRSGKRIATFFSRIAKELDEMETPSGNELFAAEMPSLMDVLDGAQKYAENGGQEGLFGDNAQEVADAIKKKQSTPMSDAHSPERNVQNDSADTVSSGANISPNEAEGEQEPTLENILQLAPSLKKAALEYGAKEESGKVTFADEERKQEFIKVAKALLGAGERKFSKAWTGSAADYDVPSLDYIGTGTGGMVHGYGLYSAEKRETASSYGDKLYHVEVPDNDVLLDEQKSFDEQTPNVRKGLEKLVRGLTLDQLENWNDVRRLGKETVIGEIMDSLSEADGMNIYGTISDLAEGQKEASELMNRYGIKGITYHDEQSGRGFVVFDDKAIKILEKFSARRQEALQEMLDGITIIPPHRVSPRKRVIADWGREMGVTVVFFKGDPSLHGFHQNGVTFLNVDSEITPQWTFWHEAMHWMKANNPDIYNDLVEAISGAEGFTKEQLDAYRREIGAPDMSDADVIEEMIADALPDVRRRVPLLRELGRRDTGVVQRVVAWIRDVMRRFHDHFHTPKGGLTSAQRVAMARAFGNLVGSIRDAEGKAIFRIENEGARITLRGGKPLPAVKFSLDKAGREGDNESRRNASVETRNQAITDSVTSLFRKEVDALKESGLSEQEIARVLGDENSDLRMRVLAPWLRQYNQFQARYPDKRGIVNRIEGREATDRSLSNEEISRRFDTFKARMERMIDDAGLVYAECAYQRAGRPSFVGFHSWQGVEQSIRKHGGNAEFKERPTTETKTSLNTKHLENQGAFSTPKLSDEKAKKDAAYRDAVKVYQTARDPADRIRAYCRLKELVREAAAEAGFVNAIPEQTAAYKVRVKAPPQKTVKVYKVFTLADDGSPTALFIGGTEKLPQGVWLDAQDAYHFRAKNGLYYVPSTQNPYTQGGKTGASVEIPNEKVRRELIAHGFLPKDSSAAKVTALAYRPGWHAGTLPFFPQGGKKAPQGSPYPNVHRYNQVVFECEMSADKDYTHEAESQPKARTKNGSLNTKKADLQYMPEDGYYFYATNPLTHGHPELGLWAISGSLKINRALSQEECDRILMQHGMTPQGWEQGRMNLSDLGYVSPVQDAARKTLAPITYDDNGHVVPLSERFNPAVDDIRFSANTQKRPKGNFKLLKERIRSFVGVAPADNLELPGRVRRTEILSPKKLEQRIKDGWIQKENIISEEQQKDGKIAVTYYPDTHDVGYADYVKSVRQVAKRNPFVKVLYDLAHKAMKKQEKLRNAFGKTLKEFNELVKNEKDLKSITAILWQGDAEGRVFSDAELRSLGANERVIKAYRLVRRELEKAYKMLRDAQTQVKTRSQTLAPESVESFKKNHWIEDADVISETLRADGTVLLTWRGGKTYDVKEKTMTAAELKLMQEDENINVTSAMPIQAALDDFRAHAGRGLYKVNYVERIKPVFRRTGYMPHFFHEWMIYEKIEDSLTGEVRYVSVGSGRTMNEAVKIGNEIAKDNSDKQYVLRPKGFDLGTENAVVIGDMDFAQMSRKLAESTEVSLADARSLLLDEAGMSLKSRHRFFGSLLERKDGKGFDQDVQWVLAHYLNGAARYIAMEEFKPAAITMYERFFGRFDDEPKNLTAQYCKNLINDVNGNPRGVEVWLNDLIKKTWIGRFISDRFGDRVALALNGELSTWNAITKLGLLNFASAAVNFSQFINVGAALNDYGYAMKGLRRALNPSAMDEKIIEASGLLDDINMADDNGGYTQRRGGKVRGIYSGIKKAGEWTLILFQKADTLMRKAAVLGAYYQGVEQKGMKTARGDELSAEALAYAQEINDDANFDYSSANAPGMFRAGSVVTQQLFQFQKYPIMQFEFMYNIMKNGTRGQKVRFFVPYVLFAGIGASIPFGGLLNQIFSGLFGLAAGDDDKDFAEEIKAEVLRWAGKDPVKKAIAETAIYGILAPTFGIDISGRIGMSNAFSGEFYGEKPKSVGGMAVQQLGGPAFNSLMNLRAQMAQGNPIEALKAVSPALGNMFQAAVGESRTTRHRVNARYDTAYDKLVHALGFRSVEESKNAFIMNYEYEQKGKAAQIKREAIQDYIADPSDENRRTINALGITDKQIKAAQAQQEHTALERAREGRPKTSGKSGASRRRKEEAQRDTLYDTLEDE